MHIGNNIQKLRKLKGIKQIEFAKMMNMHQQDISKIENKAVIKDSLLAEIADKLQTTKETIENFSGEYLIHSINQSGGQVIGIQHHPLEKIVALYESMIANKDAIIKEKDEKIKELELALEKNKP
jgi:transcriptional regulator with XRE-family HTH domain